jgi:hypothetical protein
MSGFSMLPDLHFTGGKAAWPDARAAARGAGAGTRGIAQSHAGVAGCLRPDPQGLDRAAPVRLQPAAVDAGHIAWHAEWWCLRGVRHLEQGGIRLPVASEPSLLDGADEWFDPERIGPDERWEIALPDVARQAVRGPSAGWIAAPHRAAARRR